MTEELFARIWVGVYGDYIIPERFKSIRISKSTGWPDLRCKGATDLLQWAADMDAAYGKAIEETVTGSGVHQEAHQ